MPMSRRVAALLLGLSGWLAVLDAGADPPRIPLCAGLTIVTAATTARGDFEAIKRVTRADAGAVDVTYSAEAPGADQALERVERVRRVRRLDLAQARDYAWDFRDERMEIPGSTAVGLSSRALLELKTSGRTGLRMPEGVTPGMLSGSIARVDADARVSVIVNDDTAELRAVHARGQLGGQTAELWVLDDSANPLVLQWRLGDAGLGMRVVKLSYPAAAFSRLAGRLERDGKAVLYGIFFDFGSDRIRPESEPALADMARVLRAHGNWLLAIEGHTDNVGGEAANLDLSRRRAASVRQAMVALYGIDARRLTAAGFGASRPQATNDTPQGRARNRRVELVKVQQP